MKISLPIFTLICTAFYFNATAQEHHCGTDIKMQEQLAADPEFGLRRAAIEESTQRWLEEHYDENVGRAVVTIPVVVHVVYSTTSQNISQAQIQSQIDVLNEDYGATNADVTDVPSVWTSLVADSEIRFQLANNDPDDNLTNGITRTETTVTNWNGSDDVKYTALGGHDAWPAASYLNIWVCNIGGGLLGYAYQPGINAQLDGVVIGYRYFGLDSQSATYDLGRTATHEIGHYFNLDHLWGPGGVNTNCNASDFVSDTPVQLEPNYGCNTNFPSVTCSNGPNGDMFNNYMDYGNDECLFFFTNGQKSRMLAALNGARSSLLDSDGLSNPNGIEDEILASSIQVYPNPSSEFVYIQSDQVDQAKTNLIIRDMTGRIVFSQNNVQLGHAAYPLNISNLSKGTYVLEVLTENARLSKKINILY